MTHPLSPIDTILIDRFQRGFPLVRAPFATVGGLVGLGEAETICRYRHFVDAGVITRIGAVVAPNVLGASTLAAMNVPPGDLERVAAIVSADRHVNHNYERENALNLWFVVTAPGETELQATLRDISRATGYAVRDLRLEEAFHLDLGFPLEGGTLEDRAVMRQPRLEAVDEGDSALLGSIEDGLALVPRPYREAAGRIGRHEIDVIGRLAALAEAHVIRRFGVVVRHRAVGICANAMAVWDVPDDRASALGRRFAGEPGVTLCYRRRRAGDWPFNLYCMVHARSRDDAAAVTARLDAIADGFARDHTVLFSRRCFKQTGARFSETRSAA
ncbi:MAG: Lrp/AsnC family transcriptional regulator [Notoacmeibacter sp.]|nr:Lrp/AsnC family transcriptional regulator [Notoacmeibacter sp.]